MKRHHIILALALACLGLVLLTAVQTRPTHASLSPLLLDEPRFPSEWVEAKGRVTVDWVTQPDWVAGSNNARGSAWNLGCSWTDPGGEPSLARLDQHVYHYPGVLDAMFWYWVNRPEHAYRYKLPNFEETELHKEIYPPDWSYRSASADQELVVCAIGPNSDCAMWIYWARYGQYVLDISYTGSYGMGPAVFQQFVAPVDAYFSKQLSR